MCVCLHVPPPEITRTNFLICSLFRFTQNGETVELAQRTGLNPNCKYYRILCTPVQSARIHKFALDQCGKRFSVPAMIRSMVCPRVSHYNQESWFCAELVAYALKEGGLL